MAVDLKRFRELTRVFDPIYRPYENAQDGPGDAYIAEAHDQFRRQFEALLELNDNAKLLVAGQPGCGKTTMLVSVVKWLQGMGRLAVFVDLEVQTAIQDLGLVELHLATAAELLLEIDARRYAVPASSLRPFASLIDRVLGAGAEGLADRQDPATLANALRGILRSARDDADQRRALRTELNRSLDGDPLLLLTALLADLQAYRPVIVLDGLDKLTPDQAREFFLKERKPMAEAPCAAVLTIPLSLVYEPSFNVLSERYNNADSAVLPAVRLYDFDEQKRARTRSEQGFDILRRIVSARIASIDANAVMPDAVDRAIEGSGGNIRELARLVQGSVVKAYVRRGDIVELQDVEAAIADQRESFRRTLQPRFLPVLKKVRAEFRLDNADDIGKVLLYGLWVMEYRNGTTWYALPVAVERLLDYVARV